MGVTRVPHVRDVGIERVDAGPRRIERPSQDLSCHVPHAMDHGRLEAAARNFGRDMLIGATAGQAVQGRATVPEQGVITVRHGLTNRSRRRRSN